ncbi:MAG TPA: beta-ketoacyl synthase N-terminal-like domain-containing protein [Myxococcaceae bacterium]|jgi:uncharacterized protein (TIGR02270 family)
MGPVSGQTAPVPPGVFEPTPRLDITEAILSDAAWLATEHAQLLAGSATRSLEDLAGGMEPRLIAKLDALAVGAPVTFQAQLLPALQEADPGLVFAAAFALLTSDDPAHPEAVRARLVAEDAEPDQVAAIGRALGVAPGAAAEGLVARGLKEVVAPVALAALIDASTARRLPPPFSLERALMHKHPAVRRAGLRASRLFPAGIDPAVLVPLIASADPEEKVGAIQLSLVLGGAEGWQACAEAVAARSPGWESLAPLFAAGAGEDELAPLIAALADPQTAEVAAFALGFSGRSSAADALLLAMQEAAAAPAALDAFAAITGLPLEEPHVVPPEPPEIEEGGDPGALAEPEGSLELPAPVLEAIAPWWEEAQKKVPRGRMLRGRPLASAGALEELARGPLRRRAALARELAVRSRGQLLVPTSGLAAPQLEALAAVPRTPIEADRPFGELMRERWPTSFGEVPRPAPARRVPSGTQHALAVTGIGMVSSLGYGAVDSAAAARAGMTSPAEVEALAWDKDAAENVAVMGHPVPSANGFAGYGRMLVLGADALADLVRSAGVEAGPRTALYLVLPSGHFVRRAEQKEMEGGGEDEEGAPPEPPGSRMDALKERCDESLATGLVRAARFPGQVSTAGLIYGDSPGFAQALQQAAEALAARHYDRCVVVGIDSYLEPDTLGDLASVGVLKGPDVPTGLMPGEGSGAVMLERLQDAKRRKAAVLATVGGAAYAEEKFSSLDPDPKVGVALAQALKQVVRAGRVDPSSAPLVVADLNGTNSRANDWGNALIRAGAPFNAPADLWIPALSFGEVGAATGPCALCLVARAFARGYAPSGEAVVWLWGDGGGRGAFSLHAFEDESDA